MRIVLPGIFIAVAISLLSSVALADDWQPVRGESNLREVFSDTLLSAELGGGSEASANYNADGTGELRAWGDTFPREWKVDGDDLICIKIDGKFQCYRIEKNHAKPNEYRGTVIATGEQVIFEVQPQMARVENVSKTSVGSAAQPSATEMAEKLTNPTSPIMTLGNNIDYVTFKGSLPDADDQSSLRYLFQSTFPFKLKDNKGVVFIRPAIPVFFNEPVPAAPGEYDSKGVELGDIGFDFSYGQTTKTGWVYGGGVIGLLPTATDDALGKDKWALGPEVLLGKVGKWGGLFGLLTHQWDYAGSGDQDINVTSFTYVYAFNIGGGWQVASNPVISYDHTASSDNALSLPIGIGLAKTSIIKGRPWKFQLQYWNYLEANDVFGAEHQIRLSISPVISAPWNAGK